MWQEIAASISAATGRGFHVERHRGVGGGCINQAVRLEGGGRSYFVKTHDAGHLDLFVAEADGLNLLAGNPALRTPAVICHGLSGASAYLVLEWLNLSPGGDPVALGRGLAAQHRLSADAYGAARDNYIGSTPQPNAWQSDWVGFFTRQRIGWQLQLLRGRGHGRLVALGEALLERLPALIGGRALRPSLLHGDLWGGNHAYLADGRPVVFDPAAYYGDREADLAMTELFGGFADAFYAAYREAWPLDAGYAIRREVYNLYHVLNHLNLFGAGYAAQSESMIRRLLAEAG